MPVFSVSSAGISYRREDEQGLAGLEAALDDEHLDDAVHDLLIRKHRAGIEVAVLDVMTGQRNAQILELAARDHAILVRRRDCLELLAAEDRIARETDLFDEDPDAVGYLRFLRRSLFFFGQGGSRRKFHGCLGRYAGFRE